MGWNHFERVRMRLRVGVCLSLGTLPPKKMVLGCLLFAGNSASPKRIWWCACWLPFETNQKRYPERKHLPSKTSRSVVCLFPNCPFLVVGPFKARFRQTPFPGSFGFPSKNWVPAEKQKSLGSMETPTEPTEELNIIRSRMIRTNQVPLNEYS